MSNSFFSDPRRPHAFNPVGSSKNAFARFRDTANAWMNDETRSIELLSESYAKECAFAGKPVRTSEAVLAIRTAFPNCKVRTRALADLVAVQALSYNCPVHFDAGN